MMAKWLFQTSNHRTIGPDVFFFALVLSKPQKNYCELDDVDYMLCLGGTPNLEVDNVRDNWGQEFH